MQLVGETDRDPVHRRLDEAQRLPEVRVEALGLRMTLQGRPHLREMDRPDRRHPGAEHGIRPGERRERAAGTLAVDRQPQVSHVHRLDEGDAGSERVVGKRAVEGRRERRRDRPGGGHHHRAERRRPGTRAAPA